MDRRTARDLQYVALPTAASVVHIQVVGSPPDALDPTEMRKTLDEVAHSLALLARIYSIEDLTNVPAEIPAGELVDGKFARGAHLFVSKAGKEYRRLVIQRGDMDAAITILKKAVVHGTL